MSEPKFYVMGDDKCLYEGLTKEQTLAAITEAVETHEISDVDTGFVTKLKEYNRNAQVTYWVGTQAEYNALANNNAIVGGRLYFITDDNFESNLSDALDEISDKCDTINESLSQIQTATVTSGWAYEHVDSGTLTFYKNGSHVICDIDIVFDTNSEVYSERTLLNFNSIPEAVRPRAGVSTSAAVYLYRASSLSDTGSVKISSAGLKLAYNISIAGSNVHAVGQLCYYV